MVQRGGKRPGAGRPKGSSQRATGEQYAQLSALARGHTKAALRSLVLVATKGESEAARVTAANAILDRGYGKAPQSIEHAGPNGGPIPVNLIGQLSDEDIEAIERIYAKMAAPVVSDE